MNLFIVESPLQIICAYEAILEKNEEPYLLLIRQTGRGFNDKQMKESADFFNLKYKTFKLHPDKIIIHILMNIFLWLSLSIRKFETVYLGSLYSNALKVLKVFLRGSEFFYLDDGAATLRAQIDINKGKKPSSNLYTFFQLDAIIGQKIIKHKFCNIRKTFNFRRGGESYFIGQPVEHMLGFNERDYLNCVRGIARKFSKEKPLIYIPHRVEDSRKILEIENIIILNIDTPVELYFMKNEADIPKEVYSCYSSALVSMSILFPEINIVAIKNKKIAAEDEVMDSIYNYFLESGIDVVLL
ncbi:hypothetical protein [Acinetobacter beijerinckii]|uniref:hypothetical protein n=1 Tax=Acinetobacter beijerinckii TaxID=262668 RepID=UPI003AF8161F